ncbi:hypothetical protein VTN96DRAFT_2568 [Rasamsonia emersonii]
MLPHRSSARRIPGLIRPLRPPRGHRSPLSGPRLFTNKSQLLLITASPNRPQLPFLSPLAGNRPLPPWSTHLRQHFARLISTERRDYYKRRITRGLRVALTVYLILCMFHLMKIGIYQEEIEHKWPTPPEWSWKTRWCLRSAEALQHPEEIGKLMTSWPKVAGYLREVIKRLEDPEGEGKGIREQGDGGFLVEGVGKTGYDVSMKSEPWRRGYFQALMGAAKAAENLEGWLTDWKLRLSAPAEYVAGPSNPHPKPSPAGKPQLQEENCEPASEPPEVFYIKILTTNGFSTKQKVDAALAYADWLDYKGLKGTARDVYNWAMDIAAAGLPFDAARVVDTKTGVLKNNNQDIASENIMRVSTALAVHHARSGDLQTALSIFTSVLKARRRLPEDPSPKPRRPASQPTGHFPFSDLVNKIKTILVPVKYPDAPPSGNDPPVRTVGSACEEAGLMTYIGEIIYATSSRENGLAWTRDAVDMAETTFMELSNDREDAAARERCIQCLKVGLDNWKTMVQKQVAKAQKEEQEAKKKAEKAWYGGEKRVQAKTQERKRWEAEEMIVQDRANRLLPLIDDAGLLGL